MATALCIWLTFSIASELNIYIQGVSAAPIKAHYEETGICCLSNINYVLVCLRLKHLLIICKLNSKIFLNNLLCLAEGILMTCNTERSETVYEIDCCNLLLSCWSAFIIEKKDDLHYLRLQHLLNINRRGSFVLFIIGNGACNVVSSCDPIWNNYLFN